MGTNLGLDHQLIGMKYFKSISNVRKLEEGRFDCRTNFTLLDSNSKRQYLMTF